MAALITTVTLVNDMDFDEVAITYKQVVSTIGGKGTGVVTTHPDSSTDQACIDAHSANLTALGFEFDV